MPEAYYCTGRFTASWVSYDLHPPGEGEVQVRHTHGAEKHGTMMAFYKGYGNDRGRWDRARRIHVPGEGVLWDYPLPLGNMNVGIVTAVGVGAGGLVEGDRVLSFGGFQPYANKAATACWRLEQDVPWQSAVCLDPLNFALAAARDGGIRAGDHVAVFGLGAIGLMCVRIARISGAENIIAIDPVAKRREIASLLGADTTLDPIEGGAGERIRGLTQGRGADVVVDYSGSVNALQQALVGVAFGGTIVAGGFPPPYPAGLDFGGEAHMNRPRIVFSRSESDPNADHPRWTYRRILEASFQLIRNGAVDGRPVVDPIIPFHDLPTQYPKIATDPQSTVKLGVIYPG